MVPHYSTTPDGRALIIKEMMRQGWWLNLSYWPSLWTAQFRHRDGPVAWNNYHATEETAVARAAIEALKAGA